MSLEVVSLLVWLPERMNKEVARRADDAGAALDLTAGPPTGGTSGRRPAWTPLSEAATGSISASWWYCSLTAVAVCRAEIVRRVAATTSADSFGTCPHRSRMKCTEPCESAGADERRGDRALVALAALVDDQLHPSQATARRERTGAVQDAPSSMSLRLKPRSSRCPSARTPIAMTTVRKPSGG